ncbi:uncharacterized protein BYT42DRAFT_346102 [Radiomyces spectabilis]|uniref:uncharacterized protein n=1 Tax=Radiomyces spectabilis TaxID=64574 RepID=UPI00221F4A4D|nr:uncharacterized protein BYT42DRAFT_346102 [Radiomyces spectabilis]KAI8377487.1 hypothetical protein BYT42DRAFT_346102 [Radiomyces spectabilis]
MSILTMPESSSYQQEFRYVDSYPRSLSSLSSRNSSSPIPTTKQDWQYQAPVPSKLPVSSLTMDIHSYAAYWSDESPKPSSVNGSSIDGAQYMPSSDDVNWITRPHPQEDLAMLDNDSLRSHPGASAALQMDPSFLDHMHSSLPATTSTATSSPGHTSYNPILASASSSSTTDTTVLSSKSVSASSLQASHPPSSLDMEFLPSNPHESYHSVYSVLPDQKGLQDMNPSFDMQVMPTYQGTETGPRENSQVSMAPASAVDSYAQDPPHQLQLTDLGSIHEQHQQQLLQSWVGVTMGRSPMDSPHHSPGSIHPTFSSSPGFFMPTFLDSLQEAESSTTLVKSSHSSLQGDDYGFQLSEPSTEGANTDHHRDTTMRSLGWQSQHPQQQQEQQQQDSSALLPLQQPTHSFTEQKQQLQLSSHECAAAAAQHQFQTSSYGLSSNHLETGHPAGGHLQNGHFGSSPPTSPTPNQSSSSSTNSSPPVTPMYGRLSNLSLRSGTPTPAPSIPFGNNGASMHTGFSGSRAGSLLNYSSPMPEGFEEQLRSSRRDPNDPHALMMIRKQQQVDVGTARLMQRAAHEVRLKHLLQNYLQAADPVAVGERTVVILTSKVAQKSYGTEKR